MRAIGSASELAPPTGEQPPRQFGSPSCRCPIGSALLKRKPARDGDTNIRESAGFADAETKAGQQEQVVIRYKARERSEQGPPQDNASEHAAWAQAISQGATRDLKSRVGHREYAGHPAPRNGTNVQSLLHPRPGDRETNAVEVGDHEQ